MNGTKPWYQSKGVWAGIVALLAAIAGAFGYALGPEDQETLAGLLSSIGAGIAGLLGIYGRVKADKKIE